MGYAPVASSWVKGIDYDPRTQTIYVEFNNGTEYFYADCPQEMWDTFRRTSSKGKYIHSELNSHTKGPRYSDKDPGAVQHSSV